MSATVNTKKRNRRAQALVLSAVLLTGVFACETGALGATHAMAQLSPQFHVVVDGTEQTFFNASGKEMHPLVYQDTTYLPLRAIGELMGKNVNWDQATQTISISGTRTAGAVTGKADKAARARSVSVQLCPEFTIVVDGATQYFADARGSRVYPLLYQGSTYLPLRAIGELMGKEVSWDGTTKTAILSGSASGLTVTDADSFTSGTQTSSAGSVITVEAAKNQALSHAGVSAAQATFAKQRLDWEDGHQVYEITFYSGATEYEYEIDAVTGAVLEFSSETNYNTPNNAQSAAAANTGSYIGEAKAREIALARVPGASSSNVTKLKLDRDGRESKYEVEIYYNYTEYEFEIDAFTGTILEWDSDYQYHHSYHH